MEMKTMFVTKEVHQKLKLFVVKNDFRSFNDAIEVLLDERKH